jgi:hypothetical protein
MKPNERKSQKVKKKITKKPNKKEENREENKWVTLKAQSFEKKNQFKMCKLTSSSTI